MTSINIDNKTNWRAKRDQILLSFNVCNYNEGLHNEHDRQDNQCHGQLGNLPLPDSDLQVDIELFDKETACQSNYN